MFATKRKNTKTSAIELDEMSMETHRSLSLKPRETGDMLHTKHICVCGEELGYSCTRNVVNFEVTCVCGASMGFTMPTRK